MIPHSDSPHPPGTFTTLPGDPYHRAEQLEQEITELCAHLNAATYRLLELILALDREKPWGAWGLNSCAHWLNWRCGIALGAAREKVRVAHALAGLPLVSEALRRGEISYSKVRALTRVATPENEDYLLMIARHGTAAHMEKLVRQYRSVQAAQLNDRAQRQHEGRYLKWRYEDDGSVVITCRLPPEQGTLVIKAVQAAAEALDRGPKTGTTPATNVSAETPAPESGVPMEISAETRPPDTGEQKAASAETPAPDAGEPKYVSAETPSSRHFLGEGVPTYVSEDGEARPLTGAERDALLPEEWENVSARRADGMVAMAESVLAAGPAPLGGGERYQIMVHLDAGTLDSSLEEGPALAPETLKRLGCDASLVGLLEDSEGNLLNVGRRTRAIPPAIRRALTVRDGGCRFPGCTQTRFVDGHHIHHWSDGGETRLDNLVLLCRFHHRLVHEAGYGVATGLPGTLEFTRPDGRVIEPAPAAPVPGDTGEIAVLSARRGIDVDARTGRGRWDGQPMDYAMAIDSLLQRDGDLEYRA